jgi:hypothetical protein
MGVLAAANGKSPAMTINLQAIHEAAERSQKTLMEQALRECE